MTLAPSDHDSSSDNVPRLNLGEISTRWSALKDPQRFLLRYSPAIRAYLVALIRDEHDVEDVLQDFLARFVERGLPKIDNARGRFRDYLKAAVRNAAFTFWRRKRASQLTEAQWEAIEDRAMREADAEYDSHWTKCLIERVWQAVEAYETAHAGSYPAVVLRIHLEHHEQEDSTQLARRLSAAIGRTVRPEAYRQQLRRARKLFGELLIAEIGQTLENPAREFVEAELADLGVLDRLRPLLDDLTDADE
jgi:RNA polymerase sigma-70 factor (ECF subfamily)